MLKYKFIFLFFIFVFCVLSFSFPMSKGDIYYSRLTQWYKHAEVGDWDKASSLESKLDQADLIVFKKTHHPLELKKYVNALVLKNDKSTEDWLELSRVQAILGKPTESLEALTRAKDLDPIRDDISRLYYQSTR
jgi:hypothetical protein